jgi:hypothetical protein
MGSLFRPYFEHLPPTEAISIETSLIQCKKLMGSNFLCKYNKSSISKIHEYVYIFFHQCNGPRKTLGGLRYEVSIAFKNKFDTCSLSLYRRIK